MKKAMSLLAAAVVGGALVQVASANILVAPGFEVSEGVPDATPAGPPTNGPGDQATGTGTGNPWRGWNNWVSPYGAFYTGAVAHTGSQAAKTFSGPNGGVYQFVPVTGGQTYTASAWFLNRSTDAMTTGQSDDVRLIWFDGPGGTGNNLGTSVSPTTVTNLTPQDVWTQIAFNALAPAGAQSAQFMTFFNNPASGGGALYVDDTNLALVPEPASLGLLAVGAVSVLAGRRRRQRC